MRPLPVLLCTTWLACATAGAGAASAAGAGCMSSGEAAEAVARHQVVPPAQAIVHARRAVPNADVVRALLCRDHDLVVYRITILRKDGRLVRVTVDARSGRVRTVH